MGKAIYFTLASALVLGGCSHSSTSEGSGYSSSTAGTGGGDSSSTTTGTGGKAGTGCDAASISVEGDGPTNHLGAACKGSWGIDHTAYANGYLGYPDPNSGVRQLFVSGCLSSTVEPMFGSISLMAPQTMVGTAMTGTATYANGLDTFTTDTEVTLMLTEISTAVVKGSYTANVSSANNGDKTLSGTFSVCRVPEFLGK